MIDFKNILKFIGMIDDPEKPSTVTVNGQPLISPTPEPVISKEQLTNLKSNIDNGAIPPNVGFEPEKVRAFMGEGISNPEWVKRNEPYKTTDLAGSQKEAVDRVMGIPIETFKSDYTTLGEYRQNEKTTNIPSVAIKENAPEGRDRMNAVLGHEFNHAAEDRQGANPVKVDRAKRQADIDKYKSEDLINQAREEGKAKPEETENYIKYVGGEEETRSDLYALRVARNQLTGKGMWDKWTIDDFTPELRKYAPSTFERLKINYKDENTIKMLNTFADSSKKSLTGAV